MYNHPKTDNNQMPKSVNQGRGNSERVSSQNEYLKGRNSERRFQEQSYIVDENTNALTNLLMNLAFTSIVSFLVGTLFFVAQRNESSLPSAPVPDGSPSQSAEKKTTIFERTVDNIQEIVPAPQQQAGQGTLTSMSMFLAPRKVSS
jgi:hypothetical protein